MMKWFVRRFVSLTLIAASAWAMWVGNIIARCEWTHTREQIATDLFMEEKAYLESLGYCTNVWYADMYENERVYVCNLVMEDGNSFETVITKDCGNVYMLGYMDYIAPYWES